jgi:hypothetical protein
LKQSDHCLNTILRDGLKYKDIWFHELNTVGVFERSLFALGLNVFRKAMVRMSELEIHDYMKVLFKPNTLR